MTYDPFLDPPRPLPRLGCASSLARPIAGASAVTAVVLAFVRWGIGDAIAVAAWILFFGTIAAVARADERRFRRRRNIEAHPTSRLADFPPTRSNVRIITRPREVPPS